MNRLKSFKHNISIEKILDSLNMEYKRRGKELLAFCPNEEHIETAPSWSINAEPNSKRFGIHYCFGCGYRGSVISLVKKYRNCNDVKAVKFIKAICGISGTVDEDYLLEQSLNDKSDDKKKILYKRIKIALPDEFKKLTSKSEKYFTYATQRGLTEESIKKFKVGFCHTGYYWNRLIMPIYFQGNLYSFLARNNDHRRRCKKDKRVLYVPGPKMSFIVWPYDDLDFDLDYVIIVEGLFDAIKILSWDYENVITVFGNKISEEQEELIRPFKNIYLVPDGDEGGEILKDYSKGLVYDHNVFVIELPENQDPGSISEDVFEKCFNNKKNLFSQKVRVKIKY